MIAERLTAQLLAGPPAGDAVTVARRLLAVQGQDQRGARLAIRARTTGLSATEVDRELTEERSLLITWLNRGTLYLVCSEDYHWLHVLTTPPLQNGNARRLAQEGVTPAAAERGMRVIERSLADEGPLTRTQLRERVSAAGVPTERQALVHLLMLASLRGIAVRGPMVAGETGRPRQSYPGRACSAPSIPCCSAGAHVRRSSAQRRRSSPSTGCFDRSRSCAPVPWPPGG